MATDLVEQLHEAVETHREEYIGLLTDLVRCPSTLGKEARAQKRLLAQVTCMGLDGELWDLDPTALREDPRFISVDREYRGRPNLTATLRPCGSGGRSLVLNGHIDVVSAEPASWWQYDPWGGTIEDGRLYGRGALDMKGGLVQALLAIRAVQVAGISLRGPVIFESVIEEECTGNGMLAARRRTGPVDAAVIPEPVGLAAGTANTGTMWVGVTVEGKTAYVGEVGAYVNAVEKASYLISRLHAIADEINDRFSHPAYAGQSRPFGISVGTVEGGDWPSSIPLVCRFVCRLSYPPGVDPATVQDLVESHIRSYSAEDRWLSSHPPRIDYPGFRAEGWAIDANAPLVRTLATCHRKVVRKELGYTALLGTADARYFDGTRGEQAVYYGPSGGKHHGPDEYVDLDSITTGAEVLAHLIVEWCG